MLPFAFALGDRAFDPALAPPAAFAPAAAGVALAAGPALAIGAAFALATNRPVGVLGLAVAVADRAAAAARFGVAGARVGDAAVTVAGSDAGFEAPGCAGFEDFEAAGLAWAAVGAALIAEAPGLLTAGGRAVLGAVSSAASAVVASDSWRRRFSTLARALAIALSRFTSASARRNDPVAELRLPVPFFAMDMTLPA